LGAATLRLLGWTERRPAARLLTMVRMVPDRERGRALNAMVICSSLATA